MHRWLRSMLRRNPLSTYSFPGFVDTRRIKPISLWRQPTANWELFNLFSRFLGKTPWTRCAPVQKVLYGLIVNVDAGYDYAMLDNRQHGVDGGELAVDNNNNNTTTSQRNSHQCVLMRNFLSSYGFCFLLSVLLLQRPTYALSPDGIRCFQPPLGCD